VLLMPNGDTLKHVRTKIKAGRDEIHATFAQTSFHLLYVGGVQKIGYIRMPLKSRQKKHLLASYQHFLNLLKAAKIGAKVARNALAMKVEELRLTDLVAKRTLIPLSATSRSYSPQRTQTAASQRSSSKLDGRARAYPAHLMPNV